MNELHVCRCIMQMALVTWLAYLCTAHVTSAILSLSGSAFGECVEKERETDVSNRLVIDDLGSFYPL